MNYEVVNDCTALSDQESIKFPEIISRLISAGVETYYADLLASSKTYYAKNEAYTTSCFMEAKRDVASTFDAKAVKDAIVQSQKGLIKYQEFLRKIMEAGVISYMVFIKGRKAVYFGRNGEEHVEEFPRN